MTLLPPLHFDRNVKLVPYSEALPALAARFQDVDTRTPYVLVANSALVDIRSWELSLAVLLAGGLARSALVDVVADDGLPVRRSRELAPAAWERQIEERDWGVEFFDLGSVYVAAADVEALTAEQVADAVKAAPIVPWRIRLRTDITRIVVDDRDPDCALTVATGELKNAPDVFRGLVAMSGEDGIGTYAGDPIEGNSVTIDDGTPSWGRVRHFINDDLRPAVKRPA